MGGTGDIAAAIFLALETQGTKSAAITAVADLKLSEDHRKLLRAILAIGNSNKKARDKLAHWEWGYATKLPDALLLRNPKASLPESSLEKMMQLAREGKRLQVKNLTKEEYHKFIYVYREVDLKSIIEINQRLCEYWITFRSMLNLGPNEAAKQYALLCVAPEISEKLNRQAQQD